MKKFIPKAGRRFRAFLKVERPGREHFGSPFKCIDSTDCAVNANDKDGMLCILRKHDFYFEKETADERIVVNPCLK